MLSFADSAQIGLFVEHELAVAVLGLAVLYGWIVDEVMVPSELLQLGLVLVVQLLIWNALIVE